MKDMLDKLEQYEEGTLSFEKTVYLFQKLVDSGYLWRVNNEVYVDANELIERGYVIRR